MGFQKFIIITIIITIFYSFKNSVTIEQ